MKQLQAEINRPLPENNLPFTRYLRSLTDLETQATAFERDGDKYRAYILYSRGSILALEKMAHHREYKAQAPAITKKITATGKFCLENAERLKLFLKMEEKKRIKEYEDQQETLKKQEQEERQKEAQKRQRDLEKKLEEEERQKKKLEADAENHVAMLLDRMARLKNMNSSDENALPYSSSSSPSSRKKDMGLPSSSLSSSSPSQVRKPSPHSGDLPSFSSSLSSHRPEVLYDRPDHPHSSVPPEYGFIFPDSQSSDLCSTVSSMIGLRKVKIPKPLIAEFLICAKENTLANVETCAILAGCLEHSAFVVKSLIVPKQRGSSDTCTTEEEEGIFAVLDRFSYITLGWIHTHPSQTCFLSSVDLHTHLSYQLMLPEAVAVVCSPKHGDYQVFSLVDPFGVEYLSKCAGQGFHPHPEQPPLYEKATDSHCEVMQDAARDSFTVHDLRSR